MLSPLYKVVDVLELNRADWNADGSWPMTFRIEILKCLPTGRFHARLYRLEMFRLKLVEKLPGMPYATYELWVVDDFIDTDEPLGRSAKAAKAAVIVKLNRQIYGASTKPKPERKKTRPRIARMKTD